MIYQVFLRIGELVISFFDTLTQQFELLAMQALLKSKMKKSATC